MPNFWQQLNKPFFCLAPMEEVTDFAFREMFALYSTSRRHSEGVQPTEESQRRDPSASDALGLRMTPRQNPFVMFTEFINVDGLTHPEGYKKLSIDLKYSEIQRPMVAQIWGNNPVKFKEAARIVVDMGFDGIDINMGCPQSKEIGIGACAALIRNPKLAQEIISATKEGAGDLPISVKTRLGYTTADEMGEWVKNLLEMDIAALTLHGRTKQEMSKVPAHWDKIGEAVEIRNNFKSQITNDTCKTLIIGNGDVKSREEGLARVKETSVDGVMVARGAFGSPWFFREDNHLPDVKERLNMMLEHAELFDQVLGELKSFVIMRKHFKAYASGFDGAHELRAKLMETKNLDEVKQIVEEFIESTN